MGVDRPVHRDWLFLSGVGAGLLLLVVASVHRPHKTGAFVFALLAAVPSGLIGVGCLAGTLREYWRGRRSDI